MQTEDFTGLLKKVLLGQASREETKALSLLADTDEELAGLFREIWPVGPTRMETTELEQAWARHLDRMKKQK